MYNVQYMEEKYAHNFVYSQLRPNFKNRMCVVSTSESFSVVRIKRINVKEELNALVYHMKMLSFTLAFMLWPIVEQLIVRTVHRLMCSLTLYFTHTSPTDTTINVIIIILLYRDDDKDTGNDVATHKEI